MEIDFAAIWKNVPYYITAILIGVIAAIHISTIGSLRRKLDDVHLVNLINFVSGLVYSLLAANHVVAPLYSTKNEKLIPFQWWMLSGGILHTAVIYLATVGSDNVGGFGLIFFNFGIISMCTFFDYIGFWGLPRRRITWLKCLGLCVFIVGILVGTLIDFFQDPHAHEYINLYIFAFWVAGMLVAFRFIFNINLSKAVYYRAQGPGFNYVTGSCLLLVIWGTNFSLHKDTLLANYNIPAWYECFPGTLEAALTTVGIVTLPKLGAGTYSMILTMSMIANGLIIDAQGFFGTPVRPITWGRAGGFLLLVAGCLIIIASCHTEPTTSIIESIQYDSEPTTVHRMTEVQNEAGYGGSNYEGSNCPCARYGPKVKMNNDETKSKLNTIQP